MTTVRPPLSKSKLLARSVVSATAPAEAFGLRTRRSLVAAMEQQMWFFGCDAACADGNLLVRYGFQRHRLAAHRGRSSCYRFLWHPEPDEAEPAFLVDLHGWCAGLHPVGEHRHGGGFLYVRAGNRVGWYDAPAPPAPGDYDDRSATRRLFRLLGRQPEHGFCRVAAWFLAWIEEYEEWIDAACGQDYRRRCFERAPLPWLRPEDGRAWLAEYRRGLASGTELFPR